MQSSVGGNEPSVQEVEKEATGIDFAAVKNVKQETKRKAAETYARAKTKELMKITKEPLVKPAVQKEITKETRWDPCARVKATETKYLQDFVKSRPNYPKRDKGTSILWYWELRSPKKWLCETHIDAFINLLRLRYSKHPEWFRSERLCFIDTLLCTLWSRYYGDWKNSGDATGLGRMDPPGIWDYHAGNLPEFCKSNKTWGLEVDHIYTALNITQNHWVAMMISIPDRHITIWDSILSHAAEEVIENAVRPIREIFPYVMHLMAPVDDRWQYPMDPYTYERVNSPAVPQNKQSGDCGVYCLKYIEFHSLGMDFPTFLCDANIKTIREKMAYDILHELGTTGEEERSDLKLLDLYVAPRG